MARPKYAVVVSFDGRLSVIQTGSNSGIKTKGTSIVRCNRIIGEINAK